MSDVEFLTVMSHCTKKRYRKWLNIINHDEKIRVTNQNLPKTQASKRIQGNNNDYIVCRTACFMIEPKILALEI